MIERLRVRIPAGAAGEFSSPESTLCAYSYSVSVPPPVLPQWHVKDPGHSSKSAGGRLHMKTHTPLTQRSRSGLAMLLSRHSLMGPYRATTSHATRQGTLGHSRLSSLNHKLIFTQKKKKRERKRIKKARQEVNGRTFSKNPKRPPSPPRHAHTREYSCHKK